MHIFAPKRNFETEGNYCQNFLLTQRRPDLTDSGPEPNCMSESRHQLIEQTDQMNPEPISRQNSQALSETRDPEPIIESSSSSSESTPEDEETEDEYLPEDNDPGLLETFETLQITETTEPLKTLEPIQIAEPIDPIKTSQ